MTYARSTIAALIVSSVAATGFAQLPPIVAESCPDPEPKDRSRHEKEEIETVFRRAQHLARGAWDHYLVDAFERGDFGGYEAVFGRYDLVGTEKWPSVGDFPEAVRERVKQIRDAANEWQFKIYCTDPWGNVCTNPLVSGEPTSVYAFLPLKSKEGPQPEPFEIYLCEKFWSLPAWSSGGVDERGWSQEGVILHEISHYRGNTTRGVTGAGTEDTKAFDGAAPSAARRAAAQVKNGDDATMELMFREAFFFQRFFERDPGNYGIGCSVGGARRRPGTTALPFVAFLMVFALRRFRKWAAVLCLFVLAGCAHKAAIVHAPDHDPPLHPHPEDLLCVLSVPPKVEIGTKLPVTLTFKNNSTTQIDLLWDVTTWLLMREDPLSMECGGRTVESNESRLNHTSRGLWSSARSGDYWTLQPGEQRAISNDAFILYRPPVAERCTVRLRARRVYVTPPHLNKRRRPIVWEVPIDCGTATFSVVLPEAIGPSPLDPRTHAKTDVLADQPILE